MASPRRRPFPEHTVLPGSQPEKKPKPRATRLPAAPKEQEAEEE